MEDERKEIFLVFQQALLGEVSSRLRAITVHHHHNNIRFTAYYDGEITENDRESMSCVETELIAAFPETYKIGYRVLRKDFPEPIPKNEDWVFYRKE